MKTFSALRNTSLSIGFESLEVHYNTTTLGLDGDNWESLR